LKPDHFQPWGTATCVPEDRLLEVDVDRGAAKGDEAVEGVVRAADGLRSAAGSAAAEDSEGRAGQTNLTRQALDDDTKEAEQTRNTGRARCLHGVAALLVADVALGQRRRSGRGSHRDGLGDGRRSRRRAPRGGDRKKREECKSGDFGEQHCLRES